MSSAGRILFVKHGPGRGRALPTLDETFEHVAAVDPELSAAIVHHETGSEPPDLTGVCAVWFWLADPLREAHPQCFSDASAIANAASGARLINPPDALSNTIKSVQAHLWREAGIDTPRHAAFANREELDTLLDDFPFPALIKSDWLHAQQGLRALESAADVGRLAPDEIRYPGALAELVDTREGFRGGPETVWSRFFHKQRALVFGDRVDRRSILFSENPIVSLKTCTYRPYRKRYRHPWRLLRGWAKRCVDADNEWTTGAEPHEDTLRKAARVLGLGCAAIDYATTADGRAVLWEANPYFFMPRKTRFVLAKARHFDERRERAHQTVLEFLRDLRR